jgi:hypothetical protein
MYEFRKRAAQKNFLSSVNVFVSSQTAGSRKNCKQRVFSKMSLTGLREWSFPKNNNFLPDFFLKGIVEKDVLPLVYFMKEPTWSLASYKAILNMTSNSLKY